MKNILLLVVALLVIAGGSIYIFFYQGGDNTYVKENPTPTAETTQEQASEETADKQSNEESSESEENKPIETIGTSVEGNELSAYHFGKGEKEILFIGGIHGGYSWNTALLGFELIKWFKENENKIPENVKVTVIPVLNPDGLKKVTGTTDSFTLDQVSKVESVKISGRFNANNVDLNRNFDCEWKENGTWQSRTVSGGESPFSEPESQAVKAYVEKYEPTAIITWYSAAGGVYSSTCNNGILSETKTLTNLFAQASGYKAYEEFNYYEITGDMVNWFASRKIPAISVLLTSHDQTEFTKNLAGVEAVLKHYAEDGDQ